MTRYSHLLSVILLCVCINGVQAQRDIIHPFNNPALSLDARVNNLLSLLTAEEKAGFLSGETLWRLQAIPRLGIPGFRVTDCGHGITVILDSNDNYYGCATSFPTAVGQAATWDPQLIFETGAAIAREARATGSSILLGPMVNIHRVPVGGRNYETYSEDPFLTGKLAASFIKGVQSEHIGAVIKSFVANNQQKNQEHLIANVSKRALHEIYFPAFRMAVEEADPVGIMTSYNGVNGQPTSESNYFIRDMLKGSFGFRGFVVSDWRAVVSKQSIPAGLDIEMPGPGRYMDTKDILAALKEGILTPQELDNRAGRYLRAVIRSKQLDTGKPVLRKELNTPAHRRLAKQVAEASVVLLQNKDHLLPLSKTALKKIAVFGPNAAEARITGGGSASVTTCHKVSPLQGLQAYRQQASIAYLEGAGLNGNAPLIPSEYFEVQENGKWVKGLRAEFFDGYKHEGPVKCTRIDDKMDIAYGWTAPCEDVDKWKYSVRWTGILKAPEAGKYRIGVTLNQAGVRLYIDDSLVVDEWGNPGKEVTEATFVSKSKFIELNMNKGDRKKIRFEFHKKGHFNHVRLEWELPGAPDPIADAVKLARESDVAIIYAGISNLYEGGANDKQNIDLPGKQNELISAVAAANPNTIVVLNNGTPVAMPWINEVKSVLEAFYPGQEGGSALASVLFGDVNPSGKMPDTYPVQLSDVEAMKYYPGTDSTVDYREGIYVGYRQLERDKIKPLFPFGHGLSYTSFKLTNLKVKKLKDDKVSVSVEVTNTGKRAGAEVVQVYVRQPNASTDRPVKELKGFQKMQLQPGQTRTATILLDKYAFSYYSEATEKWIMEKGKYEIAAGTSSVAIAATESVSF